MYLSWYIWKERCIVAFNENTKTCDPKTLGQIITTLILEIFTKLIQKDPSHCIEEIIVPHIIDKWKPTRHHLTTLFRLM
ncbi:hypothetical protein AQUCO_03400072v1 [Aquilegia coerulea]|uniref:Uncharacterized protein n=1 Tax=Aquilegia coerulea TaxID=218851 RepID=A0A2G5CXE1_AQUCA|nr:hypothetical protein AQUCO_03400072v1 [Aquilegia coerulea]